MSGAVATAVLASCGSTLDETVVLRLTARPATDAVSQPASAPPASDSGGPAPPQATPPRPALRTPRPSPPPRPTPTPLTTPTPFPTPAVSVELDGAPGRLLEVIDGDTFIVATRSGDVPVRVLGIDAPEFDDVGQRELAERARDALRDLIGRGPLRLVTDAEPTDAGGRLLRHVYLGNRLLAADLARQGWARALPVAPNLAEQDAVDAAVVEARAVGRGIWALQAVGLRLTVDKVREISTLSNTGTAQLDVSGWWLVSLRGKQTYRFPPGTIVEAGGSLRVASGDSSALHRFSQRNVWNNTRPDPAELRRNDGRIAAVWDDSVLPR